MIVRAFPIYASKGKSLDYYLEYIINPAKVLPETDPALHNLQNQLPDTVLQEIFATDDGRVIPVYASAYMTAPEEMIERVEYLQEVYQSYHGDARGMRGPIAYHIIVSAAPNERASDQEVHLIAVELAEELGAYPGIIATHINPVWDERFGIWRGLVKHDHLVVSAFPDVTHEMPQKLALGYRYERLREITDRIAIEHGLQILIDADHGRSDSYYAVMQGKKGASWMGAAREALSEAVAAAKDRGDYEAKVAEAGYDVQQIGRDFLYTTTGGHQVMGHKLGRTFTAERLETRWAAEREGAIDEELEKALPKDKLLYVDLPLGGDFEKAVSYHRCCLQSLARDCCEASLRSYFQQGCMYDITDRSGQLIRRAEGRQICDYLGVGDAWRSEQELTLERRLCRLEWHRKRIRREAELTCERHAESAALRFDCMCRRRARERAERIGDTQPKKPLWRPTLRLNYEEVSLFELIFLLIHEAIDPKFDSGLWEWGWELEYPLDPTDIDPALWRLSNIMYVVRTEGFHGLLRLEMERLGAKRNYEQAERELAEAKTELESLEPLWDVAWRCKRAKREVDYCCKRVGSYEELCRVYPDVVAEYEEAVHAARGMCMECWADVEQILNHCAALQTKIPELMQAVAAEYEAMRQRELSYYGLRLDREHARLKAMLPKPPLDEIIAGAEGRKEQQLDGPSKEPELEH